jgi:hypothetical protein
LANVIGDGRDIRNNATLATAILALKCGEIKFSTRSLMAALTDGRVMYVPPIIKKKIDELGIGRGELFTITKAEKKNGTRRTIEWVVGTDGSGDRKYPFNFPPRLLGFSRIHARSRHDCCDSVTFVVPQLSG